MQSISWKFSCMNVIADKYKNLHLAKYIMEPTKIHIELKVFGCILLLGLAIGTICPISCCITRMWIQIYMQTFNKKSNHHFTIYHSMFPFFCTFHTCLDGVFWSSLVVFSWPFLGSSGSFYTDYISSWLVKGISSWTTRSLVSNVHIFQCILEPKDHLCGYT
jgi:hypothetical protein